MREDQRRRAGLVEQPAPFVQQPEGGAAADLQGAGGTRGGDDGRLRVAHIVAGEKEQDAVGALQAGTLQRVAHSVSGQFRRRVEAADQAAGDLHAVFPLNAHRSKTTQRAHSGLRALHT